MSGRALVRMTVWLGSEGFSGKVKSWLGDRCVVASKVMSWRALVRMTVWLG
ncbi:hypothetical protein DPMN_076477 [Dreissena polymorpha]|uniref:Uncharacterized protein n=1 Tax=Dreissena polymorpha TaxID=45954 RepID=A0A9D3YNR0_DREPO|nr:hypothetical protein DPMN_076477 [Dreissena polymorpha]